MIKCNLRKICFEKDIRTISELQRITGVSRPTLYKMFDNKDLLTVKLESFNIVLNKLHIKKLSDLIEYVDENTEYK